MKGSIRRIDDLGRLAIPKDIRKELGIKDGDPLEIRVEEDSIRIRRYQPILEEEDK